MAQCNLLSNKQEFHPSMPLWTSHNSVITPANTLLSAHKIDSSNYVSMKRHRLSVTNANKQVYIEILSVSIYFGLASYLSISLGILVLIDILHSCQSSCKTCWRPAAGWKYMLRSTNWISTCRITLLNVEKLLLALSAWKIE